LWNFETTGWVQKAVENCFVVVWPVGNNEPSLSFLSCFALDGGFSVTDAAKEYAESDMAVGTEDYQAENEYETRDCCCNFGSDPKEASVFDDTTFLRNVAAVVVDKVEQESNYTVTIDTKRIYMGGHSNGCTAALAMAAVHSDMVAAVCCHSPALVTPFPSDGSYSKQAVPIWLAHGKYDGTVDYHGDFNGGNNYIPGAEQTNELLGAVNNCNEKIAVKGPNGAYSTTVQYDCDNDDARVVLMSLETAGHTTYMGGDLFFGDLDGAQVTSIDTTQKAWEFCSEYARASEPILELVLPGENSGIELESDSDPVIQQESDSDPVVEQEFDSDPVVEQESDLDPVTVASKAVGFAGSRFHCWKMVILQIAMLLLT
jgi:poly(3-hydroxybutyrate) depolymerase